MKTVQDTTELDISTNIHDSNSSMEKKWGFLHPSVPAHMLDSVIPLSLALNYLVI